jgi:hypothetical protein
MRNLKGRVTRHKTNKGITRPNHGSGRAGFGSVVLGTVTGSKFLTHAQPATRLGWVRVFSYNFRVTSGFFLVRVKISTRARPLALSGRVR